MGSDYPPYRRRRSPRARGWNYGAGGLYFVTAVTRGRHEWFGEIRNGVMIRSYAGEIAQARILEMPRHHSGLLLDDFVVMPDHFHLIIGIEPFPPFLVGEPRPLRKGELGTAIRSLKSEITRSCRLVISADFAWQGRYDDRILRTRAALERARRYISRNPIEWWLERGGGTDDRADRMAG